MTAGRVTPASGVLRPVFDHLERLTDDRGLFEHASHAVPRPEHGYCVDDVARGLVVACREPEPSPVVRRLASCYLAFVLDALDPEGACHNRMAVDGQWRDEASTGDWWGRALWGLGVAAASAQTPGMRARALGGFRIAAQSRSPHLRSMAFAALGAAELLRKRPDEVAARQLLTDTLAVIGGGVSDDPLWPWPEERLSYGNASIAEALILAGDALPDERALFRGLTLLEFLLRTETRDGHLSVTPVGGRGRDDAGPGFDQQPIEVSALADACGTAFRVTREPYWLSGVGLAWDWFLGDNDSATPMYDPGTGGGYDGLERHGCNLNQGAESTLAMLATAQQARRIIQPWARRALGQRATVIAHRVQAGLRPDLTRVVARLFLPGAELQSAQSRASQVVGRVMSLAEDEVEQLAAGLLRDFGGRHCDYEALLRRNASIVSAHLERAAELTAARTLLLGATFTAEYATEAAGLCNPSAVLGPDQSGLRPGQVRVALSVRGIGEGHISSIGFCSAVVGPGAQWSFEPRPLPVSVAVTTPARWGRAHLRAVLVDQGNLDELAEAALHSLPAEFEGADLEHALAKAHRDLLTRTGSAATVDLLRKAASSSYDASFAPGTDLGQRVLSPTAEEESNGMEDARFTRFTDDDGTTEYRATYTAYDGRRISPRLLISSDLRVFHAQQLAGPAARNKGMALFPRKVHGRHLALCRSDGESTSLASSAGGYVWDQPVLLRAPSAPWEMLQVGNCGPPIETDQGWLVLTHGVGPMRVYAIGTLLLDLDDPARVVGYSRTPLLSPGPDEQDGYVPNVLYSCGAFLHDGLVWIPYGIDDGRIGVAYAPLSEVLADMSSVS